MQSEAVQVLLASSYIRTCARACTSSSVCVLLMMVVDLLRGSQTFAMHLCNVRVDVMHACIYYYIITIFLLLQQCLRSAGATRTFWFSAAVGRRGDETSISCGRWGMEKKQYITNEINIGMDQLIPSYFWMEMKFHIDLNKIRIMEE